jgi:hypothetical protein
MLIVPLTVLNMRCPSVVYGNSPSHSFKNKVSTSSEGYLMFKTVRGAVNRNYLCTLMLKTVREAVNINY